MNQRATQQHNLYGIVSNQFRQVGLRLVKIGKAYLQLADAMDGAMDGLREGRYVSDEEIEMLSQWVDAHELRTSKKVQAISRELCKYPAGTDHLNLNIMKGAKAFANQYKTK